MNDTEMTMTDIEILPPLALELFLNTDLPAADILDACTPLPDIPNTFGGPKIVL
tara:strand:- start:446 stop:607 length:162 start_codon:yes stop_codon:yes gene_type:complete